MGEMGDKTQFATVALAARYESLYTVRYIEDHPRYDAG
jgi:putative Ca2+/H+ antiporter (TMEM165/GDT1 family)